MDDVYFVPYVSYSWYDEGKEVKRQRVNPDGHNMYLNSDGTVTDEMKCIVNCQRIFKHEYYKPGGKGAKKVCDAYVKRTSVANTVTKNGGTHADPSEPRDAHSVSPN